MKNILLPTDFSEAARSANEYIFNLYKNEDVRYHLVNTYNPPSSSATLVSIDDIVREDAKKSFIEEVAWVKSKGIPENRITTNVIFGDFVTVLKEESNKEGIDFVALGTTGASGIKEIIGSNAANLIKDCNKPVLAIPSNLDNITGDILFPINLSEEHSFENIDVLIEFASKFNTGIDIFYASGPTHDDYTIIEQQKDKLSKLLDGVKLNFNIEKCEEVSQRILDLVNTKNYCMLVMMPHKYGFFKRLFNPSVTSKVSMKTDIPLLAIH